jgi:hypothetical protein
MTVTGGSIKRLSLAALAAGLGRALSAYRAGRRARPGEVAAKVD